MTPQLGVEMKADPIITKMVQLSVTNISFRFVLSRMIGNNTAFEYKAASKTCMVLHPTETLLEAYYSAMGV